MTRADDAVSVLEGHLRIREWGGFRNTKEEM